MNTRISFVVLILLLGGLVYAGEKQTFQITKDWSFTRTWKSAKKGKYHFYSGKLPLRNVSDNQLGDVTARLRILDPHGEEIAKSPRLSFGDIKPGGVEKKEFIIQPGVQFSELVVEVSYQVNGHLQAIRFSSPKGELPELITRANADAPLEVRVLAHEISRRIIGKKKDKLATMTVRLRNMGGLPAQRPTAKIVYVLAKNEKAPKKPSKPEKGEAKTTIKVDGKKAVMNVLLDEGELKAGETKTYTLKIDAPEYESYIMTASATWPEQETVVTEEVVQTSGGGGDVQLGVLKVEEQKDGTLILSIPVINKGQSIEGGRLKLSLFFMDKAGKEVAQLTHTYPKAVEKGASVTVQIPVKKLPAYTSYEVGMEY